MEIRSRFSLNNKIKICVATLVGSLILVGPMTQKALAKESGGVSKARFAMGGGEGPISEVLPSIKDANYITKFEKASGYFLEGEVGTTWLSAHTELAGFGTQGGTMKLYGRPNDERRTEFYFYFVGAGLQLRLPIPAFQPWAGAGVVTGAGVISVPSDRTIHGSVIWDRENGGASGYYYNGGVDLLFGVVGVRASYARYFLYTEEMDYLSKKNLHFYYERYAAALLFGL